MRREIQISPVSVTRFFFILRKLETHHYIAIGCYECWEGFVFWLIGSEYSVYLWGFLWFHILRFYLFETYIFAIGSGGARAIHLVAWHRIMRGEIALIAMPLYYLYLYPFWLERNYLPQPILYVVTHRYLY